MKEFLKLYYPVIIIAVISMIIGGFIEREIIYHRYTNELHEFNSYYSKDYSLRLQGKIIYGDNKNY